MKLEVIHLTVIPYIGVICDEEFAVPPQESPDTKTKWYRILGGVLLWILAVGLALIGVLVFGAWNGEELAGAVFVVPTNGREPFDANFIPVLGNAHSVDAIRELVALSKSIFPYEAEHNDEVIVGVKNEGKFSAFPRLYQERGRLCCGRCYTPRQSFLVSTNHKAVAVEICRAATHVAGLQLQLVGVTVGLTDTPASNAGPRAEHYFSNYQAGSKLQGDGFFGGNRRPASSLRLFGDGYERQDDGPGRHSVGPSEDAVPTWRVPYGIFAVSLGMLTIVRGKRRSDFWCGAVCCIFGGYLVLDGYKTADPKQHGEQTQIFQHDSENVSQKPLTSPYCCITVIT